jgi:RNA polymerase primary sigma factor
MRGSRMVVADRSVTDLPAGVFKFQAVLLAGLAAGADAPGANEAERFLRAAEPPEHNDWKQTEDLTTIYVRGAAARLKEFRTTMLDGVRRVLQQPEIAADSKNSPAVLQQLLRLDAPTVQRQPGFPAVKDVQGTIDSDGAWRVRVEVRLPERPDPWLVLPVLRFTGRSGLKTEVGWAELIPEVGCELSIQGGLAFSAGVRHAAFSGVSDVRSHPVAAWMAVVEVDLRRAKEIEK